MNWNFITPNRVPLFLYISCFLISDVGVLFVLRPRNFFDEGCDASVPLDDSNGYKNHSIPNHTLRGVDKVDFIKEELEKAWPEGYFHVLILFLLPPEMALCWSVLYPEFSYALSLFKIFFVNIKGPFS